MDPYIRIKPIQYPINPNQIIYTALHQDYSSGFVGEEELPDEKTCGEILLRQLLKGGRGHFGPIEHPAYTFLCGYFPHDTVMQLRTHRVGVSFDVQSGRYTSAGLINAAKGHWDIEKVVYLRPVGHYTDRQGKKYYYSEEQRNKDKAEALHSVGLYATKIEEGYSEEHARGLAPHNQRQHFTFSANTRSLMHIFDLRAKPDAQLECQWFCELLMSVFKEISPTLAEWYLENRWKKGKLAP